MDSNGTFLYFLSETPWVEEVRFFLEFSLSLLGWTTTQAQKTGQGLAHDRPVQRQVALLAAPTLEASRGGGGGWGLPQPSSRGAQCPVLRDPCPKLLSPQGAAFCVARVL